MHFTFPSMEESVYLNWTAPLCVILTERQRRKELPETSELRGRINL
jgi:hypothetical protein